MRAALPTTLLLCAILYGLIACAQAEPQGFEIINTLPHDPQIFTQGLALDDQRMYHSSGKRGRSKVLLGEAGNTQPIATYQFDKDYFAEGLTIVGDEAYVLTWTAGELFVLDKHTLKLRRNLRYPGEGWGLAYDGTQLWLSDGSARIRRYDPATMRPLGSIEVGDAYGAVRRINELEWAHGLLFANIWMSPLLIAIDPAIGRVVAQWNLASLIPKQRNYGTDGVANGIAFDRQSGHFWLTGKGWPLIYEVRLNLPAPTSTATSSPE
jgi:glutamine cyclotransferase